MGGQRKKGLEMLALKKSGFTGEFFFSVLRSKAEDVDQNVMIFSVCNIMGLEDLLQLAYVMF